MSKKKLIVEGGYFVWLMPDGSKQPLSAEEVRKARIQLGQSKSVVTKRKQNG